MFRAQLYRIDYTEEAAKISRVTATNYVSVYGYCLLVIGGDI